MDLGFEIHNTQNWVIFRERNNVVYNDIAGERPLSTAHSFRHKTFFRYFVCRFCYDHSVKCPLYFFKQILECFAKGVMCNISSIINQGIQLKPLWREFMLLAIPPSSPFTGP